jgi:hypothetical protein
VPAAPLAPPATLVPTPATGNNKGAAPASPSDLKNGGTSGKGSDAASDRPRLPQEEPMPAGPTDTDLNYQPEPPDTSNYDDGDSSA